MRKHLAAAALLVSAANVASASLLVYEPFNGDTGALLGQSNNSTGTNWLQAAPNSALTAVNVTNTGSLTPPAALQPAGGNAVALTGVGAGSGGAVRLAFGTTSPTINSGTVYYSFLMRVDALTGSNNTIGGFFIGFNNTGNSSQTTNPTVVSAKIQSRIDPTDPTKYDLGIFTNKTVAAGDAAWTPALTVGDTVFVVAAYTFNPSSSTNDVASIWINPSAADLGAAIAPTPTATDTGGTDMAQIGSILLRQSPAPYMTLDELRVGTTWADVTSVPEPASLSLAGLAAAGLLARRGRRRA